MTRRDGDFVKTGKRGKRKRSPTRRARVGAFLTSPPHAGRSRQTSADVITRRREDMRGSKTSDRDVERAGAVDAADVDAAPAKPSLRGNAEGMASPSVEKRARAGR